MIGVVVVQMVEEALKTMFVFVLSGHNPSAMQTEYIHKSGTAIVRVDHNQNALLWMPQRTVNASVSRGEDGQSDRDTGVVLFTRVQKFCSEVNRNQQMYRGIE